MNRIRIRKWLALAFLAAAPIGAQPLDVTITSPPPGQPVFGEVDFAAEVFPPEGVARVELFVDDQLAGELRRGPFEVRVDVGDDNRPHRFLVRAHAKWDETAEALLVSPAIAVDLAVHVELQQLYVTVTGGGRRVLDLQRDEFTIVDDGLDQEMVTFGGGDVRITAVLLIDSSASMRGERLRHALRGATVFVRSLRSQDEAMIVLFSDHLLHRTPMTNDLGVMTAGLAGIRAQGGTALNDYLYLSLRQVEHLQGRRVVVLLSDGIDNHSALRMREVRWLAGRSRALIYWIRTDPRDENQTSRFSSLKAPRAFRREYEELTDTVVRSGGRIVTLESLRDAEEAFGEILRELREQYVLGYYPRTARNDGSWHRVEVRVDRSGLRVRTRGGYVDY